MNKAGAPDPDPIFILGMPRAGSTLIEQILASHSRIEGTAELPYIPALARSLVAERWRENRPYPDLLAELPPERLRLLGEAYLARARLHRKTDKPLFVDKLPNNWMEIGFIHLILPNARLIDVRRGARACGFSNFKQLFARGHAFSYALEDIGFYYRGYADLLAHFDSVLPGKIHRVRHERLVGEPESEVRALLAFLDVPFEESCLTFWENRRPVRTPSAEQVRRPITADHVDAWRPFARYLEPLDRALGAALAP